MRQISPKNKKTFSIFTVLIIVVVGCIVLMLFQNLSASQVYAVSMNSVVYDANGNYVDVSADGSLKKQWNDEFSLSLLNGNTYKLGKNSVIKSGNNLQVYGGGYRVFDDGSVKTLSERTEIANINTTGLYKLGDRQYLLIGRNIAMENKEFSTDDYITVEIDKSGNAYLRNDKVNFKAVAPIVLVSDDTTFDVSNEMLKTADVLTDLKKVNGSTNEYVARPSDKSTADTSDSNENTNSESTNPSSDSPVSASTGGGHNLGNETSGGSGGGTSANIDISGLDNLNNIVTDIIDGINSLINQNANKPSSDAGEKSRILLNGVTVGVNSMNVDYVINDTQNLYKSAFLKIIKSSDSELDTDKNSVIQLNKSETSKEIFNLYPNKAYSVSLGYIDAKGEEQIVDIVSVRTKKISADINVGKIVDDVLYFNLKLDNDFYLDSGNIVVYNDTSLGSSMPIDISAATSSAGWNGSLLIDKSADQYTVKLEDTVYDENGTKTDINISAETVISNTWYDKIIRALFG